MRIGYARVSTQDQDTQAQIAALTAAGCELLFQEKASGGRWDRPELQRLLGQLRQGDVVVVWKLDRLSRSLKDVLVTQQGAFRKSLTFHLGRTPVEARPTTTSRARGSPKPGTGFAQYSSSLNAARFSRPTRSRHSTSRGQARQPMMSVRNSSRSSTSRTVPSRVPPPSTMRGRRGSSLKTVVAVTTFRSSPHLPHARTPAAVRDR